MTDDFKEKLEVDKESIHNAVKYQLPIQITTYTVPRNMEIYVREVLQMFLTECHQEHMTEYLNFCNGELLTNAKKANTKRVYFQEKGLDINDPDDYQKGMENFKDETLANIDYYLELQKKAGLYVKIILQLKGEQIRVEIRNNSKLTVFEQERIINKMNAVQQYSSMEEVFTKVLDQSEGAGLGIIIIILMLQKIGLSKENYQVFTDGEETITRIILPCNEKIFSGSEILTYEFVKLQQAIPVFEQKFVEIVNIIQKPKIDRTELLNSIKTDPSIFFLLLKETVKDNPDKIEFKEIFNNISDARLREIFSMNSVGTRNDTNDENNESDKLVYYVENDENREKIWNHAYKVGQFAYNLMKNYPEYQNTISCEKMYSLGLMNCIGSILLECATKPQKEYVTDLCQQFEETEKMIDVFYSGNSCPHISMIYCKKIGVKDDYSAIIGCWNNMNYVSDKIINEVSILYMAEALQLYSEGIAEFYQFDEKILSKFGIETEKQLSDLLEKLNKAVEF